MKKNLILFLIGATLVIIGALIKILKINFNPDYFYLIGFLLEFIGVFGVIKYFIKKDKK